MGIEEVINKIPVVTSVKVYWVCPFSSVKLQIIRILSIWKSRKSFGVFLLTFLKDYTV